MSVEIVEAPARQSGSGPGFEFGMILALWRRDTLRLLRERTRWLGVVAQPLMLWVILGAGFAESLVIPGAEGVTSMQFLYPGILGMVLLFTSIFSTMSVIEDRSSGFLQGVLVAPGSPLALVLGKTAGVTTIVAVQSALFLLVAPLAGYPWSGIDWPFLLLVIVLSNTALTCANFVFAWVLNSTQAYHGLMSIVLMPMWIVSGAMFPPPSGLMGTVVALNPMTYGIAGLRWGMGVPAGNLPSPTWCIGVLSVCTVLSLAAAVRITRRR
jgi:ABC-2 type transport system permease protein